MTVRSNALAAYARQYAFVLELDLDFCSLTHGTSPCTSTHSTGDECYNTFPTCWDKPNYNKTVKTYKFCEIGMPIPFGETIYPFIVDWKYSPAKLQEKKGLARNHKMEITLRDGSDTDSGIDPYFSTRTAAGSTFLRRLRARNKDFNGRFARVRQGYVVDPWDWDTFEDRLFIIDSIDGPDEDGRIKITLKDSLKLTERAKVPEDTDAILGIELKDYELEGFALGGSSTTIKLPSSASGLDNYYNGMGLYIPSGTLFGQYRTISDYNGVTKTATVSVAFDDYEPDLTTYVQVGVLSLTLTDGMGANLTTPASEPEMVRIGKEIIQYTSKSGDVISWPDLSYRGKFRTPIEKHKVKDSVQQCLVFNDKRIYTVLIGLLNAAGISNTYIDTTGFQTEDDNWLGTNWNITWAYSKPDDIDNALRELLYATNCVMWWDIKDQKVKLKKLAPEFATPPLLTDDTGIREGSVSIEFQDGERLTRAGVAFDIESGTEDAKKIVNYLRVSVVVNADAEGANGQNAVKAEILGAEFFGESNEKAAIISASNNLAHKLDAPIDIGFQCDPREELSIGDFIDVETQGIVDKTGAKQRTRFLVTYVKDEGTHLEIEGRSTIYNKRFAWIADNSAGDYPSDSAYAHVSNNDGLMAAGGDEGYSICP